MYISEAGTILRWFSGAYLKRPSGHILWSLLSVDPELSASLPNIDCILYHCHLALWSRDNSVGIETGWPAVVRLPVGARDFPSPKRPDRIWGPPNLL
jgi:hypothetical protein